MNSTLCIIVPCYNEEAALPYFLQEIRKVADNMSTTFQLDFEILFINDGSRDKTLQILRQAAQEDKRIRYISFARNFGKEAAMYAGFQNCTGDYAAVMDADMQDPPSLLPEMYQALQSGEYDSVATRRVTRKGEPPIRSFFARCFYKLINRISDADIVDGARDFRLMTRQMVDAILSMTPKVFSAGLVFVRNGCRMKMSSELLVKQNGRSGSCFCIRWKALQPFRPHHWQSPRLLVFCFA